MKLVVFAHTPPPFHGQSYMIRLMLESLAGRASAAPTSTQSGQAPVSSASATRQRIRCYHVNSRLSSGAQDIGRARGLKGIRLLRFCCEAIWHRYVHGAKALYFVPGAAWRASLLRDWLVMALCRPFFKVLIYHWHAGGLGHWLQAEARPWERRICHGLLGRPDLSIVLSEYGRGDALSLQSRRVRVIPNGIPDPAPGFVREILPRRLARARERQRLLAAASTGPNPSPGGMARFQVLYLGLCGREKGLFDCVEGVIRANQALRDRGAPVRVQLQVAGDFASPRDQAAFAERLGRSDARFQEGEPGDGRSPASGQAPMIRYCGFVHGAAKHQLLSESDCLCYPTCYSAETFGLVLVEAMAYGLSMVATRWRHLPELLPPNYPGLVAPAAPGEITAAILGHIERPYDGTLRDYFLARFTLDRFTTDLEAALREVLGGVS